MPNDTNEPNPAEPGDLIYLVAELADAAVVEAVNLRDYAKSSQILMGMVNEIGAMKQRMNEGAVTRHQADDFAQRCRSLLDELFRSNTPDSNPIAL